MERTGYLKKCEIIYNMLTLDEKNEADFLKLLSCCNHTYEILNE
jgi:predicted transcriptional regulator